MFPKAETIVLSQNYRSTQNIVAISQNLITKNSARDFKHIFSNEEVGSLPEVIIAENSRQEAMIIAKIIKSLVEDNFEYRDIAVLYRLHKIAHQVIAEFENFGIPVRSRSKQVSFEKNEIGVISYLRVILDSDDEEAFMNVFNWPKRGLGDSSKLRLKNTASLKNLTLYGSLEYLTHNNPGKGNKGFTELYSLLNYFKKNLNTMSPKEIITSLESKYNLGELPHLIQLSESFTQTGKEALDLFLQSVNCNQDPNVVTFSSIHQAKGQE